MRLHDLRQLARLYSIETSYVDSAGKRKEASRESLVAALRMRLPEGAGDLEDALRARREELAHRAIEPVIVVWDEPLHLGLSGPAEVRLESGETLDVRDGMLLPIGYHALVTRHGESALFVAPRQAWAPRERSWGIFAPLYAMQSGHGEAIGDLGTMRLYAEWMHSLGGGILATLPLNAIDAANDPSPYSPVSRLFWNELYLDVAALPEYRGEPLPTEESLDVDWRRVSDTKARLLHILAERFVPDADFEAFARDARDYAAFRGDERYHLYVQYRMAQQMRALGDDARRHGPGLYLDFPIGVSPSGYDAWRYREHFAKNASVGAPPDLFFTKGQNWGFAPLDPDAIRERHHSYFRECIRHQLAYAGILRIDHVMGLHRLFWIPTGGEPADGVYVRYPADELFAILTIESRRAQSVIVGEDLGTVPAEVPRMMAEHGVRRMFVIEYEQKAAASPKTSIASINTHDMPTFAGFFHGDDIGDRLEQGLLDENGAVDERVRRDAVLRSITSVLTARGLLRNGSRGDAAVLEALLTFLGRSDAEMVLVNLEDLWLEREPVNRPGVPEKSWRRKMRVPLEAARADETVVRLLRAVDQARRKVDGDTREEGLRRGNDRRRKAAEAEADDVRKDDRGTAQAGDAEAGHRLRG